MVGRPPHQQDKYPACEKRPLLWPALAEVRWEDLYGTPRESPYPVRETYADRKLWFGDLYLEVSGGVFTDAVASSGDNSSAVAELVQVIKEQKGEVRAAALAALKKLDPAAVRKAGLE